MCEKKFFRSFSKISGSEGIYCLFYCLAKGVRMALDKRNYAQLVETTVELANKVGGREIISRVVDDLKDESEPYRKMVMETIDKVLIIFTTSCLLMTQLDHLQPRKR